MTEGLEEAVHQFLALRRIAVAGVSRNGKGVGNLIYRKLRAAGYHVFALNPNAREVEGSVSYPDIRSIPGGVEGVIVATRPTVSAAVVRDCAENKVPWVWPHRSFGNGSVSEEVLRLCREHGIRVIGGACPMMYCPPVDFGHACVKWILRLTGGLPRPGAS